jgi:hypothetical protein
MKPFDCEMCRKKIPPVDAIVRWHYDPVKKQALMLQVVHDSFPCNAKGEGNFFNRSLKLMYVFANMPEFIAYIKRLDVKEKDLKKFVQLIEKDRSYIRRHNPDKKEIKKMVIRMEGAGEWTGRP